MRSLFKRRLAQNIHTVNHLQRPFLRFASFLTMLTMLVSLVWVPELASAQTTPLTLTFSHPRGFYTNAFSLTLTASAGSIRYTLDGNTPSPTSGTEYKGPISIPNNKNSIVRAIAYTSSTVKTAVTTNTYIFLAAVRNQSDSQPTGGWPTKFAADEQATWPETHPNAGQTTTNTYPADYGMDNDVLSQYPNAQYLSAMRSLPTMSITTDQRNLWDPSVGIYWNSSAKENAPVDPFSNSVSPGKWERPISIEWINPDGTTGFVENAGMRTHGQASRRPNRTPKKSFRIYFKKGYSSTGAGSLDFQLFDDPTAAGKIDRMVLRNGGNRSWPYFDRDQRKDADYVNDEVARRLWGQMGNLTAHGTYVHLYINGLYWGLYNTTERLDEKFLVTYLGLPELDAQGKPNYDLVESEEEQDDAAVASFGTIDAWNELLSLVNGTAPIDNNLYQTIATKIDVVNLADYFIHVHYIGKTDWPDHNWNIYRARTGPDTRFKFIAWDNDSGLNKVTQDTTNLKETPINGVYDTPLHVFERLATNAEFIQVLTDRFYKHVIDPTGVLAPVNCAAVYTQVSNIVDQPVIAESARWGDYSRDLYPTTNAADKPFPAYLYSRDLPDAYTDPANAVLDTDQKTWVDVRSEKLSTYCPNRSTILLDQYQNQHPWYKAPLKVPGISQRGGTVTAPVTLNNTDNKGLGDIYYTTNGTDPRTTFGALATTGVTNGADSASVTVTRATTIKARVKNGNDWSPLMEYTFAPKQDWSGLVINELHYNPAPTATTPDAKQLEFVELYNKGTTPLQLDGVSFLRGVTYTFPANTNIAPGQYLVLASNAVTFKSRYNFAPFGMYAGSLANEGEAVELIDAVKTAVDSVTYRSIAPWPTEPNGLGNSLSLYSPLLDNSLAANWRASAATATWPASGGTPGSANGFVTASQVSPTITWNAPAAIGYGTALGDAQLNATASYNGQPVEGTFSYTPATASMLKAGANQSLGVTFTPKDTTTYAPVSATAAITVNKALLTITAEPKLKRIGQANPELTVTYSGFVNNETATNLDTPVTLGTTATVESPAGEYPITVSGASSANYDITFVNSTMTVSNKFIPTITWTKPAAIRSGTPLSGAQLNATATVDGQTVAGTFSYTPAAGTVLPAGNNHELKVVFTPTDTATYESASAMTTISVVAEAEVVQFKVMLPMLAR